MLHYILQIIAFQLFFLIIYDVFLKKETFFNWNRAYLLTTAVLSVILPFIKIQSFKNVVPKEFIIPLPEVTIGNLALVDATQVTDIVVNETSKLQFSWELLFYLGASVALLIFIVKLIKIMTLIYKNPKHWNKNLRIVTLLKSNTAFSFFYYVFLGEYIKEEDKPTVIKHEAVHVNQKHTLDLLLFEIFRIVFWFNPLIYMYQNRIASLHEFIADAEAVKSQNKNEYYQDLLSQIFETENVSFINAFYKKSLIKKRIAMLSKSKSKQTQLIKYTLLIPLVFGMLLYTSSYAQDKIKVESVVENKATQEMTDEELENMYYQKLVDLYEVGADLGSVFTDEHLPKTDNYIWARQDLFKIRAFFKFMEELRVKRLKEDGIYKEEDSSNYKTLFKKHKSYVDYLEYKKTNEAKRAWDNQTKDGVLRLVVDDIGNMTKEEKELMEKKMEMIENDDYFKDLLIVAVNGRAKTLIKGKTKANNSKNTKPIDQKVNENHVQDPIEVPFAKIDEVPTLSGCDELTNNEEKKKCVATEISKHVQQNFNTKLAENKNLVGKQRITVVFKIDTNGNVFGVRARAPHPQLEQEAVRVIKTLPQFTPGKQKGEKVVVPYSLPIVFQVETSKKPNKEGVNSIPIKNQDENTEVPFALIDKVPTYPGCENLSSEEESRKCMADSISKFVQKKFNTDLAKELKLTGRQRINVIFKIDKDGNITGIRSRGPHPKLEDEAKRVIGLLPKMNPGKHEGQSVIVPYSLPIVFQVAEGSNKSKDIQSPEEKPKSDKYEKTIDKLKTIANGDGLPFAIVDKVPMLPECESLATNNEQKKCVSSQITKIVQKNFNTDLAKKLGLKGKRQIMVVFQINKQGNLKNIKARAPHPDLEAEAIKTVKLLPKFIPGEHEGKKVNVSYALPIVFMVK